MAADYRKFKTPFYRITVGDSFWNRQVELPHHIARLVEKVEIIENMSVNDTSVPSSVSISFIEGSREPASPDYNLGTAGLYKIPSDGDNVDMDIAGSLTNRAGLITDLRFSGSGGITFLTEYEKKTGKLDNKIQEDVQGNDTTREYKYEPKAPLFLFQERNRIKVTWGYLEDPDTVRSVMMTIQVVTTEFPQEGMPRTTITGLSFTSIADQLATRKAKVFGERTITSKSGDSITVFKDIKTDDLIRKIAKDANMAAIISENVSNNIADKDKQKMWLAGESFQQFMKKMADLSGCYYEIRANPNTGKETIFFIKQEDFEKSVVVSDPELLNWKGPGSILKSVNVNADFGGMQGNKQSSIDEKGNEISINDEVAREVLVQFNKEKAMASNPKGNNPSPEAISISENIANGGTTGTVDTTPLQSEENKQNRAAVRSNKDSKMIQIDVSTIGYTKLIPGVMEITGIGVRYSGKYRMISVTHTIDSNGYSCKASGTSQMLAAGGVTISDGALKGEEPTVNRQLVNAPTTTSKFGDAQTTPQKQYEDFMHKGISPKSTK